jgi:hypothetical protein
VGQPSLASGSGTVLLLIFYSYADLITMIDWSQPIVLAHLCPAIEKLKDAIWCGIYVLKKVKTPYWSLAACMKDFVNKGSAFVEASVGAFYLLWNTTALALGVQKWLEHNGFVNLSSTYLN